MKKEAGISSLETTFMNILRWLLLIIAILLAALLIKNKI